MDLNRVTLIGNVTRDPESKVTPTGKNVASFSMATNQQWKDSQGNVQKRAEFHNIVAWGKLAEICQQYVMRGMKIYAEGALQTRQWEAQDGQKRTRTEIVLENMIMLSPKNTAGAPANPTTGKALPKPEDYSQPVAPTADALEIPLEDIPF